MIKKILTIFILFTATFFTTVSVQAATLRWKTMPVSVCVPNNQYAPLMKKAFSEWSRVSQNKVRFIYTCQNPKITISYATNKQKSLTKYSYDGNGYMLKAHIEMGLMTKQGRPVDNELLVLLMEHEIGHALGIAGHSNTPKSILQPTVMKGYTITRDNIAEISKRYK